MRLPLEELRSRIFASKKLTRQKEARKPFEDKLADAARVTDLLLETRLSSAVLDVLKLVAQAEAAGVIGRWAVAGGMAVIYHSEPVLTVDLDLLVLLPQSGLLVDLGPTYRFFTSKGAETVDEYLRYSGLKFQFIPVGNPLEELALKTAIQVEEGFPVVDIEPLIALKLQVGRPKDKFHIQTILDAPRRPVDFAALDRLVDEYGLREKWNAFSGTHP